MSAGREDFAGEPARGNDELQSPEPLVELDLAGNTLYVSQAARTRFPDLQALGSWHPVLVHVASILPRFRHGEKRSFSFEVTHEQSAYHQMVYYVPDSLLVRVFLTEQYRAKERGGNATAWAKAWEEHNTRLFDLVKGIERDAVEPVSTLLERLQECRQSLGDPPDARLRRLWRGLLAELWEAARAALYGDLGPASKHAAAARRLERELRRRLESLCGG